MSFKQFARVLGLIVAALSIGAAVVVSGQSADESYLMEFEVAEDGTRFVFDDLNLFEDGMPAYGSAFVTQGYIYPVGTLSGSNGALENGEPEFPDLVLGTWTCYGWMIGDGAHTTTGAWVISTQVYEFNDGSTIITDGFEIADLDQPVVRAVTGGTGQHRGASGEMIQMLRGFTDQMGVNLSVQFQLDAPMVPEVAAAANTTSSLLESWDSVAIG